MPPIPWALWATNQITTPEPLQTLPEALLQKNEALSIMVLSNKP